MKYIRYIIVILLININIVFAQLPELFDLNGYKDLKFGMSIEDIFIYEEESK